MVTLWLTITAIIPALPLATTSAVTDEEGGYSHGIWSNVQMIDWSESLCNAGSHVSVKIPCYFGMMKFELLSNQTLEYVFAAPFLITSTLVTD